MDQRGLENPGEKGRETQDNQPSLSSLLISCWHCQLKSLPSCAGCLLCAWQGPKSNNIFVFSNTSLSTSVSF
jgi:hypothetical protein